MASFNQSVKNYLGRHPKLRNGIRRLRWETKKIPVVRNVSMSFDSWFFSEKTAGERPNADPDGVDDYFESYVQPLEKQVRGRVLELGSGHGYVTRRIAKNPAVTEIVAFDKINEFRFPASNIRFQSGDLTDPALVLPSGFDTVITTEFVEHIPEEAFVRLLPKIRAALAPGGIFIGSTPRNPTPYKKFSGSPYHVREYNRRDLERLLASEFQNVAVKPVSEYCLIWHAEKKA